MLTFFRRIRKGLLGTGASSPRGSSRRASKYLLYAIGEIALVVIGILIALQINNWNEERLNRIEESQFLHKITNDLKSDTAALNSGLSAIQSKAIFLISISNNELFQLEKSEGINNIFQSRIQNLFAPRDNAINEIINSGKLNILKNDDIKEKIHDYYRLIETMNITLSIKFSEWPKLISELIPGEASYNLRIGRKNQFSEETEQQIIQNILASRDELEKTINAELGFAGKQEQAFNLILRRAKELLEYLTEGRYKKH